ncbi:MAG: hypothetical protein MUE94_02100 [Verrucomicrobia bacterium]|jgi:hypothetical protein|nr:hypothetical protein [Verrucomicrobiota bacterium]
MSSADIRRRWWGVVCLGGAILMVVWGNFFIPQSWPPEGQMVFWLICLGFTLAAILVACTDLVALRRQTRAERRALFEQTLHAIEEETAHAASRH